MDDDPTSRLIAQMLVRDLGHTCDTATDGTEAWDAFQSRRPDVVIIDGNWADFFQLQQGKAELAASRGWTPARFWVSLAGNLNDFFLERDYESH
ncbi:MAG: response regulator [Actinomycetota bacterium]